MAPIRLGIDVGSTTAKLVIATRAGEVLCSVYRRHHAEPLAALRGMLLEAQAQLGAIPVQVQVTGSAGLGISERFRLPFVQEVVASAEVVRQRYPRVRTLIDIGGEDAKMIFFRQAGMPDIRMNGSCAGGTGAFIDQMATLLHVSLPELNTLAEQHTTIYPIASRCGVFARTDVQNLLSREIGRENIAASIFHAVVLQTVATLSRGYDPAPQVLFSGGPLTFLPALRHAFMRVLNLGEPDVLRADHAELLPATGATLVEAAGTLELSLADLLARLDGPGLGAAGQGHRLVPLFLDHAVFADWEQTRRAQRVARVELATLAGAPCFVGIDSGSTTTKLVVIDAQGRVAFSHYGPNGGNAIGAVQHALSQLRDAFAPLASPPVIARAAVTGYGEDLIRSAFGCDDGLVETLAHYRAARAFDPQVSFILDIGGQDMKAIFIHDGHIQNIEINEACSSGCGSFIETFANTMGYHVADFAQSAVSASAPCDLGTRCTVFMNSKVKQAQREGAQVGEISAGLAYSVIKNALHKVLKLTDTAQLGDHIIVQGGTFRNPAVHRALELLLDRPVVCPDIAELMGAYGCALSARDVWQAAGGAPPASRFVELAGLETALQYRKKYVNCRGCTNSCTVTRMTFPNGNIFFTGNRCEKFYTSNGTPQRKGTSLLARKEQLLFDRPTAPAGTPRLTVGIPRVLNMYENYPFWATLLVECGLAVHLSDPSSNALYSQGAGTIASENICFPAKLVHGHIFNLIDAGVDRIFYPMITFEQPEFADADNSFNCPIVTGYPEVMRSLVNPEARRNIPLDRPVITFHRADLLKRGCWRYLESLGVARAAFERAFARAQQAQAQYKAAVRASGQEILTRARAEGRLVALLLCRPYHMDTLINHKVPDILAGFGVDVITDDAVPCEHARLNTRHTITQWEYANRYFHAARWAAAQDDVEVVQLNSFGCGPDVTAVDEVRAILAEAGRGHTVIRIDEIESPGSARLRLRSMVEAVRARRGLPRIHHPRQTTRVFQKQDRRRTILVSEIAHFAAIPIVRPLRDMGYTVEVLPRPQRESVDLGLKYVNNEICYPAIIVVGDFIKALRSGKYNLDEVAVGISQTGGQCRDSCYLTMLKKALVANGFAQVPVVSVASNFSPINAQPGFQLNYAVYIQKLMYALALADGLSAMYHAVAARELNPGEALALADRYMARLDSTALKLQRRPILETLRQAVAEFNRIPVRPGDLPAVAIVGEIYLKLNWFGNNHVVQWLLSQGIEVVVPPLLEYFASSFINWDVDVQSHLKPRNLLWGVSHLVRRYVEGFLHETDRVMQGFRFYRPSHPIGHIAETAAQVMDLSNHFGEGWLIPGEIGTYVQQGIPNVLCLQPFGCIANHVAAKGLEKRMKELYPQLNILFLDADAGTSEVNFYNRLYFFVNHAREAHAASPA